VRAELRGEIVIDQNRFVALSATFAARLAAGRRHVTERLPFESLTLRRRGRDALPWLACLEVESMLLIAHSPNARAIILSRARHKIIRAASFNKKIKIEPCIPCSRIDCLSLSLA
jgi:hypothetical protein